MAGRHAFRGDPPNQGLLFLQLGWPQPGREPGWAADWGLGARLFWFLGDPLAWNIWWSPLKLKSQVAGGSERQPTFPGMVGPV